MLLVRWAVCACTAPARARGGGAHRLLQPQPPAAPPASDGCQRFQFARACSIMFYILLLLGEGGQAQLGVHGCCAALRVRVDEPLCNRCVVQLLWLLATANFNAMQRCSKSDLARAAAGVKNKKPRPAIYPPHLPAAFTRHIYPPHLPATFVLLRCAPATARQKHCVLRSQAATEGGGGAVAEDSRRPLRLF